MTKHKSAEAKRLTRLGGAVYDWSNVLFSGGSVFDTSGKDAMREAALMTDTPENRDLLQAAVYRCGLPQDKANALAEWVRWDDETLKRLWAMLPEESGRGFFGMQRFMLEELAEYAKGTWPDVHEFADMVEEGDGDVAGMWLVVQSSNVIHFKRGRNLVLVWLDTNAAQQIAVSCPDLDHPPVGIAINVNVSDDIEHVVFDTVDQAVAAVVERLAQVDKEGK